MKVDGRSWACNRPWALFESKKFDSFCLLLCCFHVVWYVLSCFRVAIRTVRVAFACFIFVLLSYCFCVSNVLVPVQFHRDQRSACSLVRIITPSAEGH